MGHMVKYPDKRDGSTLFDFYGNVIPASGGGWPTVNGSGSGNLVAQTGAGDTVGYNLTDLGSGGISIASSGTGDLDLASSAGISMIDNNNAGIIIQENAAAGSITLSMTGAVAPSHEIDLTAYSSKIALNYGNAGNILITALGINIIATGADTTAGLVSENGLAVVDAIRVQLGNETGGQVGLYDAVPVAQPAAIAPPSGGTTVDSQARAAISAILAALGAAAGGIGITA